MIHLSNLFGLLFLLISLLVLDLDSSATSYCSAKQFLSGIFLFRCIDIVQLLATSHQLFSFVKEHPKVIAFKVCLIYFLQYIINSLQHPYYQSIKSHVAVIKKLFVPFLD